MHARSEPSVVPTPDRTGASSPLERLWSRYHKRPTRALRNRLVEQYQAHVLGIARRFALRLPPSVDRGDLETAASFGLIAAIEGFDPTRGVAFEAYCERRVRGALLDELRNQDWMPRPMRARVEELRRVREQLRAQLEREPLDTDLAQALELSLEQFDQLFGPGSRATPNPGQAMHLEVVEDPRSVMEEALESEELYRLVYARLSRIESRIVHLRYWEERSLREIGVLLAMSESQVCKIHLRVLERLKLRISEQDI
jgi:RNA polymerase sigma factor FliA